MSDTQGIDAGLREALRQLRMTAKDARYDWSEIMGIRLSRLADEIEAAAPPDPRKDLAAPEPYCGEKWESESPVEEAIRVLLRRYGYVEAADDWDLICDIQNADDIRWQAKLLGEKLDELGVPRDTGIQSDGGDNYSLWGRVSLALGPERLAEMRGAKR